MDAVNDWQALTSGKDDFRETDAEMRLKLSSTLLKTLLERYTYNDFLSLVEIFLYYQKWITKLEY